MRRFEDLRKSGCLIDLDGTVWEDGVAIPGVVEAIAAVRSAGVAVRFITNTTRKPRGALASALTSVGIPATEEDVLNAPWAAAAWLRQRGARRVWPLVAEAALLEFRDFQIDRESPEVVIVGDLGDRWTFETLDDAFRALVAGAELAALQRNRYWKTGGRLSLDAGPFVAALEYASDQTAHLVGKPSRAYFEGGLDALGLPAERVVMLGDDLEADVEGARAAGLTGVAVRSGKFSPDDEERARRSADAVLDSLADLPAWLGIA